MCQKIIRAFSLVLKSIHFKSKNSNLISLRIKHNFDISFKYFSSNIPFCELNRQQLNDWLAEQGIDYILQQSKLWPTSGKDLISSSISDIDEKFKFKVSE